MRKKNEHRAEFGGSPMKFKRDWPLIYRDFIGGPILVSVIFGLFLYIPFFKAGKTEILLLITLMLLGGFSVCWLLAYLAGILTNYILLTEEGIIFSQRNKPLTVLPWNSIVKISRTRYIGGKTLLFEGISGEKIWFYPTNKIECYIHDNHPELDTIFPDKKAYVKWSEVSSFLHGTGDGSLSHVNTGDGTMQNTGDGSLWSDKTI